MAFSFIIALTPAHADEALRPLCPDRPGKGTSACTVDQGHFQLEIDAFDGTFDRSGGVTTDSYVVFSPQLKYGVTDTFDIEASLAPFNRVRTHDSASGMTATVNGIGDLFLRGKWNFLGNGDNAFAAVVEPFVKIPTAAHDIGNGAMEGGLIVPLGYDLGNNWSLSATPEADLLANAAGGGRHFALTNVIGIGRSFDGGVALGAEIWGSQDEDPSGSTTQYSFDLDAAWQPGSLPDVQLDGGINFGLNAATPDTQVYAGISKRF